MEIANEFNKFDNSGTHIRSIGRTNVANVIRRVFARTAKGSAVRTVFFDIFSPLSTAGIRQSSNVDGSNCFLEELMRCLFRSDVQLKRHMKETLHRYKMDTISLKVCFQHDSKWRRTRRDRAKISQPFEGKASRCYATELLKSSGT